MRRNPLRLLSRAVFLLVISSRPAVALADPPLQLPLSTQETSGPLTLTVRHRIEWNRPAGTLSWRRLEADLPGEARLSVVPGFFDLRSTETQQIGLRLQMRDGSIEADPLIAIGKDWSSPVRIQLQPRDVAWVDPEVRATSLSVDLRAELDSRLLEGPLRTLQRLDVFRIEVKSVTAGLFEIRDIEARGRWLRPSWTLEEVRASAFSGRLRIEGEGVWEAGSPPLVSLALELEGLDLHELLRAFNIPKADQIRARMSGSMHIKAEGRSWEILDFDLHADEGSVYLDRQLIYDILAPSFSEVLTQEQVAQTLNSVFGDAKMIPFEEMSFRGSLAPDALRLRLPLRNEALDLDIEPRIDRVLLWDIWDKLIETGLENVRGFEVR